jgi:membrane-bound lytic murein transglycosylase MltF
MGSPALAIRSAVATLLVVACGQADTSGREPEPATAEADTAEDVLETPSLADAAVEVREETGIGVIREPWTGDFEAMVDRRLIRVAVAHSRTLFFLDGPRPRGLTYDALTAFERFVNERAGTRALEIHVVVDPVPRDKLFSSVVEGHADIAAANLTITAGRLELVDFSDPLLEEVREVVVTGPARPRLEALEDLAGAEVHVRASSSYRESLEALNRRLGEAGLAPVRIEYADERLEDEDILELVNAGVLPATVVDSHIARLWEQVLGDLIVHDDLFLRDGGEIAWAFRKGSPELAAVINEFARTNRAGTLLGNMMLRRYLTEIDYLVHPYADGGKDRFERMRPVFERYAAEYGFDPLLLLAQGYQESGLDQSARSRAGAVGVMQILPSTAADPSVGIPDISTVDANVHAGVKYLRQIIDRYFSNPAIGPVDRHLLAFAAYNAGPARVARLRAQAEQEGLDPDVWFQNVERVAARRVGREPVRYVSKIFKYYLAYRTIADLEADREKEE